MKYTETKQQSSELLRLIVPLMARHEAACNPLTFALWYEYLAGLNPGLKKCVDEILDNNQLMTDVQVAALHDIHIRKRDIEAQEKYESDFRRLVDGVSGVTTAANRRAEDFADSLGRHGRELGVPSAPEKMANITQMLLQDTLQMRDAMRMLNEELRASLAEVGQLRKELERTQTQALIDPLTGLKNRRGLERVIENLQGDPHNRLRGCALLMVDIDHFKRINDLHGHVLGDKVICTVAQLLVAAVKGQDTVSRWGGEEFLVLLPETPLAGARTLAEHLRTTIARGRIRRLDSSEYIGAVTVSIGVADHHADESFEDFVQRTDLALYAAKRAGRNRVQIASESTVTAPATSVQI